MKTIYSHRLLANFAFAFICLLFVSSYSLAEEAQDKKEASTISEMFTMGTAYLNFRYRYEYADDDAVEKSGKASTLRSRLGFRTAELLNLSAEVEAEDVSPIGNDLYNSTINGKTDRAVIADPNSTEVNQAFLSFSGIENTTIKGGRHRFVLDNHRFIGDVGWRQNDQTHDGVVLTNTSLHKTELLYAYTANVNRIFSDKSPVGDYDTNLNIFHYAYTGLSAGKLVGYVYLLDVNDAPALSSASYGLSFKGKQDASEDLAILYDLEYAFQQDYENNPVSYDAHYYRADVGVSFSGLTINAGYESLGSDNGLAAFTTPFATTHRWNGWADKFTTIPATGLQDAFAGLSYTITRPDCLLNDTTLSAVFHHFSADEGSATYGTEWDFDLTKKIFENYSVGLKYANYNAKSFAEDTEKLILTLSANFGA